MPISNELEHKLYSVHGVGFHSQTIESQHHHWFEFVNANFDEKV